MHRRYLLGLVCVVAGCSSGASPAAPATTQPTGFSVTTTATVDPATSGAPGDATGSTAVLTLPPTTLPPGLTTTDVASQSPVDTAPVSAPAPTPAPTAAPTTAPTTAAPTTVPPTTAPAAPVDGYVVLAGDTLYGTARAFNVTLDQLLAVNDPTVTQVIHAGDVLRLPSGARPLRSTDIPTVRYTVVAGDTVTAIAQRHDTTPAQVLALNDLLGTPDQLRVGQALLVPNLA